MASEGRGSSPGLLRDTRTAMSQDNVEILRRGVDAYNRLDVSTMAERTTPDFEWFPVMVGAFERGSFRGREGIAAYFDDIRDSWEHLRVCVDELRDLGDRVVMLGRVEGRGDAAASRSMRRSGCWPSFAAADSRASAPTSTTTRDSRPWGRRTSVSRRPAPAGSKPLRAALPPLLLGRANSVRIGAEHAAVARLGLSVSPQLPHL